jgi:Golgi SNAP receptor complex protein 1
MHASYPIIHIITVTKTKQLVQSIPDVTTNDLFLAESGMAGSTHTVASTAEDEAAQRHDIQRALTTLQDLVTRQLQPRAEQLGKSLLVKRYREILFDLSGDFETSRQAHTRKVERSKLMGGVVTAKAGQHQHGNVDHLMREGNHIHNSTTAAASVLHQATEIRNDLRSQGLSLGRARSGMGQIANNIPGINVLVDQIRKKRSKDERIVIGVIASCILFTLYYLFGG